MAACCVALVTYGCGAPTTSTATDGKVIFVDTCGGCHTLASAGTDGGSGPNLDEVKPSAAEIAKQVAAGGGGMPAFDGDLSQAQITAVSDFVASSAGQ